MNIREYIKNSWSSSFRESKDCEYSDYLPYKYSSPCADGLFFYLYYWDTYFINKGLLIDNFEQQALNNILNMAFLIKKYGFMPNSSSVYMSNRTQVPLFSMMCDDYYEHTKSIEFIPEVIDAMIIEYDFFMNERNTSNGLNRYFSNADAKYHKEFANYYKSRVKVIINDFDDETIGLNALAECESGWDFSPRFKQNCINYNPIDLNSIMYKNELILAKFTKLIGIKSNYLDLASQRKNKMNEIYFIKKKYFDYNFIEHNFNELVSVASLLPFVVGLSNDKETFKELISKLIFDNGLAATEKSICDNNNYQWAYPNMWPCLTYFAFEAAINLDEEQIAEEIGTKYLNTVEEEFVRSGCLWEKYDVNFKTKAVVHEYNETKMLGWTAGVYVYIDNYFKSRGR